MGSAKLDHFDRQKTFPKDMTDEERMAQRSVFRLASRWVTSRSTHLPELQESHKKKKISSDDGRVKKVKLFQKELKNKSSGRCVVC